MQQVFIKAFEIGVKQSLKMFQRGRISPGELAKNAEQVMKATEKVAKAAARAKK